MKTIVLIDSGNTRLKLGAIESTEPRAADPGGPHAAAHSARFAQGGSGTGIASDGAPAQGHGDIQAHALENDDIQSLKAWLASLPGAPVAALGTNVAGQARRAAIETVLAGIHCPIRWIVPRARAFGLTSRYTRPEQLGPDRWAAMLGVLHVRPALAAPHPPFLLASFGTATTLDTVSSGNVFEGGVILPGPVMMRRSLASGTANLPLAQGAATAYPTDTQHAIASGVAAAQAGAVLRQWLAGLQRYGNAPCVYVAGGGWQEVEAETRYLLTHAAAAMGRLPPTITVIENPVLHGLARIATTTDPDQT